MPNDNFNTCMARLKTFYNAKRSPKKAAHLAKTALEKFSINYVHIDPSGGFQADFALIPGENPDDPTQPNALCRYGRIVKSASWNPVDTFNDWLVPVRQTIWNFMWMSYCIDNHLRSLNRTKKVNFSRWNPYNTTAYQHFAHLIVDLNDQVKLTEVDRLRAHICTFQRAIHAEYKRCRDWYITTTHEADAGVFLSPFLAPPIDIDWCSLADKMLSALECKEGKVYEAIKGKNKLSHYRHLVGWMKGMASNTVPHPLAARPYHTCAMQLYNVAFQCDVGIPRFTKD
jgi:hypothetical protein